MVLLEHNQRSIGDDETGEEAASRDLESASSASTLRMFFFFWKSVGDFFASYWR